MTISGEQILQAVQKNGGLNPNWPAAQRQVMEQYLKRDLPQALQDLLDEPASAELIVQAQLEQHRCFLAADMPRRLLQAIIPNHPALAQGIAKFEIKVRTLISQMEPVADDFAELLRQSGMQERDYLLTLPLKVGLTRKILQRQITLGELLLEQPEIILQSSIS